jgi:hypothetical protein
MERRDGEVKKLYRDRLLKLADVVEGDSDHFDMEAWVRRKGLLWGTGKRMAPIDEDVEKVVERNYCAPAPEKISATGIVEVVTTLWRKGKDGMPHCGTTLCLAGRACYEWPRSVRNAGKRIGTWVEAGAVVLGLEVHVAADLFSKNNWPEWAKKEVIKGWERVISRQARAKVEAKVAAKLLRQLAAGENPWAGESAYQEGEY